MGKKYTADTFEGAVTGTASGNVARAGDTMFGDLELGNGSNLILSQNTYPYGSIDFAAVGATGNPSYQIVGQNNPGTSSLALRGFGSSALEDSFVVKSLSGSLYNYAPKPIRIGADAAANELDDFEEGDANLTFGLAYYYPGSAVSFYSGAQPGDFSGWSDNSKYVKVGSSVTVYIDITFNNSSAQPPNWLSGSHATWLGGLPFSVAGSYTSDYNKTSPLHGDYGFGINLSTYDSDNGFQIRPYKWGTYGMYFGFSSNNTQSKTSPLRNNVFNYSIGYSSYGVRQITGVIHYRTTQ